MILSERILGCLTGLAVGDALGMPAEMLTQEQIRKEFGWVDSLKSAPSWHPHHLLAPGRITDDTGQMLSVAHAFDKDGNITSESVAKKLLDWAEQEKDILDLVLGPSTRQALTELRKGGDSRQTGQHGKTNGAAYRAVAVGLVNVYHPERLMQQVVEVCLPTHGTTVAISGAVAIAAAIMEACQEKSTLESITSAAMESAVEGRKHGAWVWSTPLESRIKLAVDLVQKSPEPEAALKKIADYVGVDMLVPESVAAVFGIINLAKGDPMKAAIYGANIGGDTDTIAALAGAICGTWRGTASIDPAMVSEIEKVSKIDLKAEAKYLEKLIEANR
jgi:ADP-ribosylglycohydrolase